MPALHSVEIAAQYAIQRPLVPDRRSRPSYNGYGRHADRICGDSISGNRRRAEELSVAPDDVIRAYLHRSRDALIWKLDGLSEYDLRRPLTPTGTNLLGLIKHTASVTADYLGAVFYEWIGTDR